MLYYAAICMHSLPFVLIAKKLAAICMHSLPFVLIAKKLAVRNTVLSDNKSRKRWQPQLSTEVLIIIH